MPDSDLWRILEYDKIASNAADALREGAGIAVLQGPPGVGKSWLARGVGVVWQSAGGSTVIAQGDSLRSDIAFHPFGFAMAGLDSGLKALGPALAGMARAGETLIGTAGIVTATVQGLARIRRNRRRNRTLYLGDIEQQVLYELNRLGGKKPILLVADNLHWWDGRSLEFLGRMRSEPIRQAFPFLAEMRVLAVQTTEPYQSVANPAEHEALLLPMDTRHFDVGRVPRQGFEEVLAALGAGATPPADVADTVYAFSGGHLALASKCADRLARGEVDDLVSAADADDFLTALLTERIRSLGDMGKQALTLLQVAAVLGLTFRRDEVTCVAGVDKAETSRLLRYCRDEDMVELFDGIGRFVHDLYRQHFLTFAAQNRTGIHERLSDCLRQLRPAEYDLRCLNALDAERPDEAAALAVQAGLESEREGRPWEMLPPRIVEAVESGGLTAVMHTFSAALDHLKEYRFDACLEALATLPRDLPTCLVAEADYVRAMCLMSTRSEDHRADGRSILDSWMGYEEDEPELGIRLLRLLLYGRSHLADKEPGRELEGRIRRVLIDRVSFDASAKDALYTLDRCAGSLYPPDLALVRNREAAEYYGPEEGQTLLRRPVEYYRCLVNLGASLIANSRYDDAAAVYRDLEDMVGTYASGVFPRLDLPRTNAVLAAYRQGALDADQAVARQREIVESCKVEGDPFYVENALAVYLALAGHHDEALRLLDGLDAELTRSRRSPEPSMVYLIRSNRCAVRFVAGNIETAQAEWKELAYVVDKIPYSFRSILVRRHELLGEVIAGGQTMSAREFDVCLVAAGRRELGPLWENFGRGFRMPEIEFWREN